MIAELLAKTRLHTNSPTILIINEAMERPSMNLKLLFLVANRCAIIKTANIIYAIIFTMVTSIRPGVPFNFIFESTMIVIDIYLVLILM